MSGEIRTGKGAKQPFIFSHQRSSWLDEPEREGWIPTPALIELLDAPPGARVLDFGTGTARYALALARAHPDVIVVACDVQPEMLEIARQRAGDSRLANIVVADSKSLPGAAYDRILALNVLHEIDDETLRGIASLVAPGGSVLVIDWDATVERPTGPPAEHTHAPGEAADRLIRAGLTSMERIGDARFPYHFIFRVRG